MRTMAGAPRLRLTHRLGMNLNLLKFLLLAGAVLVQAGCASVTDSPSDAAIPGLEQSQSNEDASHGWGANVQGNPQ